MASTSGSTNNKKQRALKSQAQEIVNNVYKFLSVQKEEFNLNYNVVQSTAEATGVPPPMVAKICCGPKTSTVGGTSTPSSAQKKKQGGENKISSNDMIDGIIRRKIHAFYIAKQVCPTVKDLLHELKQEDIGDCGKDILQKKMQEIGFNWKVCENGRKVLIERSYIAAWRRRYLLAVKEFKQSNRAIVYLDETSVDAGHAVNSKWWQVGEEMGATRPVSKGSRLIILHAGGEQGFIKNALLIFKSQTAPGDNHGQINSENFLKWMESKVIPNLPPQSVVVMKNTAYNCVQRKKRPNSVSLKVTMQAWLTEQGLLFTPDMTKAELLELIKTVPLKKYYILDELLEKHNHTFLRLPPHHPDINPLKLVWEDVKENVVKNCSSKDIGVRKTFVEKCFTNYTAEMWKPHCSRIQNIENDYLVNEDILDDRIDDIIISPPDSTSTDNSEDESDESDDED